MDLYKIKTRSMRLRMMRRQQVMDILLKSLYRIFVAALGILGIAIIVAADRTGHDYVMIAGAIPVYISVLLMRS